MSNDRDNQESSCSFNVQRYTQGLRILAVDDDRVCLKILSAILKKCGYQFYTTTDTAKAYDIFKENKYSYDLVLIDVYNNPNGFKLAKFINLELDIPIVFMSADNRKEAVMNSIKHGAQNYLVKPIRYEELKVIWQHVARKDFLKLKKTSPENAIPSQSQTDHNNAQECEIKARGRRKSQILVPKKPRFSWKNEELNNKFIHVVEKLGANAVPTEIVKMMKEPNLSRDNVASHLQKYKKNRDKEKEKTKMILEEYERVTKHQFITGQNYQNGLVQPIAYTREICNPAMPQSSFPYRPPIGNHIGHNPMMMSQCLGPMQDMNGMRFNAFYPRPMTMENNFYGTYLYNIDPIPIARPNNDSLLMPLPTSSFGSTQTQSAQVSQPTDFLPIVTSNPSNGQVQGGISIELKGNEENTNLSTETTQESMDCLNWDLSIIDETLFNSDFSFSSTDEDLFTMFNNNSASNL